MHVLIIYAHPSEQSVTNELKKSFIKGLEEANHTYEVTDLYAMHFDPVISKKEYEKDAFYDSSLSKDPIILAQQEKIQNADALAFVYPVFWSECPAILTGYFQRVMNCGFAYIDARMKVLEKVICLVSMGGQEDDHIHAKQIKAMRTVMLEDRINARAKHKEMYFFGQTSREEKYAENREERLKSYYDKAFHLGNTL